MNKYMEMMYEMAADSDHEECPFCAVADITNEWVSDRFEREPCDYGIYSSEYDNACEFCPHSMLTGVTLNGNCWHSGRSVWRKYKNFFRGKKKGWWK